MRRLALLLGLMVADLVLVMALSLPVIALGGMTAKRFRSLPILRSLKIHGWAAIDGLA